MKPEAYSGMDVFIDTVVLVLPVLLSCLAGWLLGRVVSRLVGRFLPEALRTPAASGVVAGGIVVAVFGVPFIRPWSWLAAYSAMSGLIYLFWQVLALIILVMAVISSVRSRRRADNAARADPIQDP